jgi:hypothetical protein
MQAQIVSKPIDDAYARRVEWHVRVVSVLEIKAHLRAGGLGFGAGAAC